MQENTVYTSMQYNKLTGH